VPVPGIICVLGVLNPVMAVRLPPEKRGVPMLGSITPALRVVPNEFRAKLFRVAAVPVEKAGANAVLRVPVTAAV
jgi:hypothetical protein